MNRATTNRRTFQSSFFAFCLTISAIIAATTGIAIHAQTSPVKSSGVTIPEKSKFYLYVLAGQSNMAGRGVVTPADRQPMDRVLTLDKNGKWVPAVDPLHFDKPGAGVGVGRTFAAEMLKDLPKDVVIGLIPTAAGGSAIASWRPGGYHDQTKSHPYDDAIKRIAIASQAGTVKGILWHQGESDCTPEKSAVYEKELHELIARLRAQLKSPDLPFIVGQMGQFPEKPWDDAKKRVDQIHRELPQKIKETAFVNSDGLGHKGDQIHFNSESYREFGKRYAQAMKSLMTPEKSK